MVMFLALHPRVLIILNSSDLLEYLAMSQTLSLRREQRSGIDTIKFHIRPETLYGKVTKTQVNITHKRAKISALSQQVIIRQGTYKMVYEKLRQFLRGT